MSMARFTEEFKPEAVKQITEHHRPVADVAKRLGVSTHNLCAWVKGQGKPEEQRQQESNEVVELRRGAPANLSITHNFEALTVYRGRSRSVTLQ